ncbi:MAG: DnaJ domain-containing protein [Candidatus Aminicenantes bacterium]
MNHIAAHLHDIHFNKRSGRLIFKREDVVKYFFFQDGELLQVKTNRPEERLGEVLFNLERLPKDAHAHIEDYIEPNQNIGEALRKRGVISESDLEDALTQQLRETTLNTFPYFDGQLAFQERTDFAGESGKPKLSIPLLIEYGIRRMQPDKAMRSWLAGKVPSQKRTTFAYLLTADEKVILDKIDGLAPAEAVARQAPPPQDLFWKSLFLFYCLDIVDLKGEGQAAASSSDGETARNGSSGPEMTASIDDVLTIHNNRAAKNFYQILNVPRTASDEDIKKAYFQMARRFHPDRFGQDVAREYKKQIDDVFDAITNAYRTLSNKALRTAYDAKSAPPPQEDVQSAARMAETKFRQGKTLYSQERYNEAVSYLREAIRDKKDKGDYYLLLAMAEAKVPGYSKRAEEDFLKAISMEPWNPEGYVGLGMLYRSEGLQTKALKMFEKAVQTDPEHVAAREAYDELSGGGKKKGLKGLFSLDVFGSGKKKK